MRSRKCNLVALLLSRGARPSVANTQGLTPRQEALGEVAEVFRCFEKKVNFDFCLSHVPGHEGLSVALPHCYMPSFCKMYFYLSYLLLFNDW